MTEAEEAGYFIVAKQKEHPVNPPPRPPACLLRRSPSTQKGGTLIDFSGQDLVEHQRKMLSPDGYRPAFCRRCNHPVLHLHDYPQRRLRSDPASAVISVVRYLCAACNAVWRILPGFLARHLHRRWDVVEAAVAGAIGLPAPPSHPDQPSVPAGTLRRWLRRLMSLALLLVQILCQSAAPTLERVGSVVGLGGTRAALVLVFVDAYEVAPGSSLASLAALVHRLCPGVRLM